MFPISTFNASDWYWIVGGDTTKVFSSNSGDYVLISDLRFLDWQAQGNVPTKIASEKELGEVLSTEKSARPVAVGVLDGFQTTLAGVGVRHPLYKILFQMNNDIRELKGLAPLTPAQALAALKGIQ